MDFFADHNMHQVVLNCINKAVSKKDLLPSEETIWFKFTMLMFKNYPTEKVFEQIAMAQEQSLDPSWFKNKYNKEEFKEKFVEPIAIASSVKRKRILEHNNKDGITAQITAKISIIGIADKYGLRPLGKPKRICPFHNDSNPSLSLNDKLGLFNCFGCKAQGNIIDFVYLLKKNNIKLIK